MYREEEKQMILDNFKNHVIRDHQVLYRSGSPRVEVMTWGNKNGSSNCRIDYMLRNGSLAVYGDLGDAVYCWYGETSLEWISDLNLWYFHGKCCASEYKDGRRPYEWDCRDALREVKRAVRNNIKEDVSEGFFYYRDNPEAKGELKELFGACCEDHNGFHSYCRTGDPAIAINDDDWWEYIPSCGEHIPTRIRMHLIGLKLAFGKPIGRYC